MPVTMVDLDSIVVPWVPQNGHKSKKHRRRQQHQRAAAQYGQYVRYGIGIAAGISVVRWIKRRVEALPVVGILASPFLCLMPTVLLGTAVGAAVVYGIEEGDPLAAQKQLVPKVKTHLRKAHREVANMAGEVGRGLRDIHSQHLAAADAAAREVEAAIPRLASSLDAAAAEAEAALLPVAERHVALLTQLDRSLKDAWEESSRSGGSSSSRQQLLPHHRRIAVAADGDASSSSGGGW